MPDLPTRLLAALAVSIFAGCAATPPQPQPPQWVSIFDGESFDGWTAKITGQPLGEDPDGLFAAEAGRLSVRYAPGTAFGDRFGHLFYDRPLSHYRIRLDYRFLDAQAINAPDWAFMNSGLMIHAEPPESLELEAPFPISVEAQFLGRPDRESARTTGNVCTPGTIVSIGGLPVVEHCINSETPAGVTGEWVTFEAYVRGSELVQLFINGALALEMTDLQLDPQGEALTSGYIALQAESHSVEFRSIELMDLERQ